MKATPEDVAKWRITLWDSDSDHASMKATPEDVAKQLVSVLQSGQISASMKATPEDVAKSTADAVVDDPTIRRGLNEGHARRRGEAGQERHPQRLATRLNEGHARRRGEADSAKGGSSSSRSASMKATPEDVAKTLRST